MKTREKHRVARRREAIGRLLETRAKDLSRVPRPSFFIRVCVQRIIRRSHFSRERTKGNGTKDSARSRSTICPPGSVPRLLRFRNALPSSPIFRTGNRLFPVIELRIDTWLLSKIDSILPKEWETVEARLRILLSKRRTEYEVFSNRWTVDDCEYRRNAKRRSKYIFLFTTYSLIGRCVETRRKVKTHIMVYNVFSNG